MKNEEKFEDIIRSRFSEKRDLPFDEANWENIKKMTDASREKRKRRKWLFIFFMGLFTGVGIMLTVIPGSKSNTQLAESKSKESLPSSYEKTAKEELKDKTKATPVTPVPIKTGSPEKKPGENSDKSVKISSANKANQSAAIQNQTAAMPVSTAKKINSSVNLNKKPVSDIALSRGTQDEKISENVTSVEESGVVSVQLKKKNENASSSEENMKSQEVTSAKDESPEILPVIVENTNPGNHSADSSGTLSLAVPVLNRDSPVKKQDSTVGAKQKTTEVKQPAKENVVRKNMLSIEIGTAFAFGWNYNDSVEGRGFTPLLGIKYTRSLGTKWLLNTGLQCTSVGYLNYSPHTVKHINSSFGYSSSDTTVATTWLYYLTLPLQIHYKLNDKNYIGIGGTVSYMITGSGKITTYKQSDDFGVTDKKVSLQYGYVKGFNPWNASLMLVYTRKFSNRISASLNPYFGLMDIKNNSYFSKSKLERDLGVKLIFSFNIFK